MATPVDEIRAWMQEFDRFLQALRRGMAADARQPDDERLKRLTAMQSRLRDGYLKSLADMFWRQSYPAQDALREAYLVTLNTHKLVADDVFVELAELAHRMRIDPRVFVQGHLETVKAWMISSPLLNPRSRTYSDQLFRDFTQYPLLPATYATNPEAVPMGLLERAGEGLTRDLAAVGDLPDKGQSPHSILSADTEHLFGLAFLFLQWNLIARGAFRVITDDEIGYWYTGTGVAVQIMRDEVLGPFSRLERQALIDEALPRARFHRAQGRLLQQRLAALYGIHSHEVPVLFTTFIGFPLANSPFAMSDRVHGVNGVTEVISAYAGRLNADNQDDRDPISVDRLVAKSADHVGQRRQVLGELSRRGFFLHSHSQPKLKVAFRLAERSLHVAAMRSRRSDRFVLVAGDVTGSGTRLLIDNASIKRHSNAYIAHAGPTLLAAQDGRPPLSLRPASWRRTSAEMRDAAIREQALKSVPDTLTGQGALVTDLLWNRDIRAALRKADSSPGTMDLHDTETRALAWRAVLAADSRRKPGPKPGQELDELFRIIQRYLTHFTRHTYFNIRDDGASYLDSDWPRDISGREFYDCGVYATRVAYDIFRAVSGSAIRVEFQFVTFLNHICIVGHVGNASFLVNNDRLFGPAPMKRLKDPATTRLAAVLTWAERAFATVYNVRFAISPIIVPDLTLDTARSDAAFRKDIWAHYQAAIAWGLDPANDLPSVYHAAIQEFDRRSRELDRLLATISRTAANTSPEMVSATTQALDLYALAEGLAKACNFKTFDHFAKTRRKLFVGFFDLEGAPDQPVTLPMYRVAGLLKKSPRSKAQDRLAALPRGASHADALTDLFRNRSAVP